MGKRRNRETEEREETWTPGTPDPPDLLAPSSPPDHILEEGMTHFSDKQVFGPFWSFSLWQVSKV